MTVFKLLLKIVVAAGDSAAYPVCLDLRGIWYMCLVWCWGWPAW